MVYTRINLLAKIVVEENDCVLADEERIKRIIASVVGLYISQTYPTIDFLIRKFIEYNNSPKSIEDIRDFFLHCIELDSRRLDTCFNNNTVGISKRFRDSGMNTYIELCEYFNIMDYEYLGNNLYW